MEEMPYFTIDGQNYTLDEKENRWSISDFSHSPKTCFFIGADLLPGKTCCEFSPEMFPHSGQVID